MKVINSNLSYNIYVVTIFCAMSVKRIEISDKIVHVRGGKHPSRSTARSLSLIRSEILKHHENMPI